WGLTSSYLRKFVPGASSIVLIIISGILFWIIIWRSQYEITVNLLSDFWDKNLINIFVSPLKFSEWIISFLILGVVKAFASFSFALLVAFLLYRIQIFFYGFYMIPFALLLMMAGWWVGFFVAGIILRYGTKVQTFAWATIGILAPFSAIYYPLSVLPDWAQKFALIVPTSYVFEGSREVINKGVLDLNKVYASLALNIIYLVLSLIFLRRSFNKALENGLVNVH
ncbi:ABC transporter permease, partial [Patescibacteria group bacterium]|nr:ABC transporter permease [Patescibacteria group bacterium]